MLKLDICTIESDFDRFCAKCASGTGMDFARLALVSHAAVTSGHHAT